MIVVYELTYTASKMFLFELRNLIVNRENGRSGNGMFAASLCMCAVSTAAFRL